MSDLPELKPCPFCGEVPERYTTMCGHAIESNCLIAHHTRDGYPKLVMIEEWNRRADLAPAPVIFDDIHNAVAAIVDGEEMWSAYDVAQAIHTLLTKGRGGV